MRQFCFDLKIESGEWRLSLQDRDVDGLLSKILSMEGRNTDKATFLKIFQSIDKNGDGVCDIDELTVCNGSTPRDSVGAIMLTPYALQVFLKKLFYTQVEIDEFIRIADADSNGQVRDTLIASGRLSMPISQSPSGGERSISSWSPPLP